MKKIENVLDRLNDKELAYFIKFKLQTYTKPTQEFILQYIETNRKITQQQLFFLLNNENQIKSQEKYMLCERCGSDKMFAYDVKWQIPVFQVGVEGEFASLYERVTGEDYKKIKIECFVCGNIIINPNNENIPIWKKIIKTIFP